MRIRSWTAVLFVVDVSSDSEKKMIHGCQLAAFFIAISKQIHRVCSDIATPAGDWV